jgi:hypothetical protein
LKRAVETKSFLASLDLGDPAAENEFTKLSEYYVETDEFHKVLAGESELLSVEKGRASQLSSLGYGGRHSESRRNLFQPIS